MPPYIDPSNIQNSAARHAAESIYNSIKDHLTPDNRRWQDPFGAWGDLPNTMLDGLDNFVT